MRPTHSLTRRFATLLTVCAAVLVLSAPMAAADPAKPTNYRSTVLEVLPHTAALHAEVVGGDGFLDLRVERGHTAEVQGYEGEPWLRVLADGTVEENQRSTATYLNSNRYGKAVIPPGAGREQAIANPEWKTIGHDGSHIWHDHRIHYMTPEIAPHLMPGTNRVLLGERPDGRWVIPVTVDGTAVEIVGELVVLPAPNPWRSWVIVAAVVVAAGIAASAWQRRAALDIGLGLVAVGSVAGLVAGFSELSVVPAAAGGSPVAVALPAIAVVAVLLGAVLRNRPTRGIAVLAGAAALLAWGILRAAALSHALPLSGLSPEVARLLIALVIGCALGGALAGIRSGALALGSLEDLDRPPGPDLTP